MAAGIVFELLGMWGSLFAAPLKDFNMLWIIIPLYLNWIFTEFYQEKKGTSFGNAISNGVTLLWVGADWGKTTVAAFTSGAIGLDATFAVKLAVALMTLAYGLLIIILGIRVQKVGHYLGRIRVVTYFALMLTPIFYGAVQPELLTITAILLFLPVFYLIVEVIDRLAPTPKAFEDENMPGAGMGASSDFSMPSLGAGTSGAGGGAMPDFGAGGDIGGMPKI